MTTVCGHLAYTLESVQSQAGETLRRTIAPVFAVADFRRAVEALGQTHKGGDIDSAALAYLDMTLRCVQCHKYVREYQTGSDKLK